MAENQSVADVEKYDLADVEEIVRTEVAKVLDANGLGDDSLKRLVTESKDAVVAVLTLRFRKVGEALKNHPGVTVRR